MILILINQHSILMERNVAHVSEILVLHIIREHLKIVMESPKKMTSDKKILLETIKVQTFQYLHQTIEIALLFRNILIIQQSMV